MALLDNFQELNILTIAVRLVLAMAVGGILGGERGRKNRPAGFRTYMLVSVGSAIVMMTNLYAYELEYLSDPVRMGAQVISGIGFLGAGTIIVTGRNQVKGITTAAGLWTAACCGLAIGIGFYAGALLGGLAIFLIMVLMQRVDEYIHQRSKSIELYVEYDKSSSFSDFLVYAGEAQFEVADIQIIKNKLSGSANLCATMLAKSRVPRTHPEMLETLEKAPGLHYIEEI